MASNRITLGLLLVLALFGCDTKAVPERDADRIDAPDGSFCIVVTVTEEHSPYGVEGYLYVAQPDGSKRQLVADYFTDGHGELLSFIEWDSDEQAFEYTGKGTPQLLRP